MPTATERAIADSKDRVDGIVPKSTADVVALKTGKKVYGGQGFYNRVSKIDESTGDQAIEDKVGGTYAKLKRGQRIPMTKLANNPSLEMPQAIAMKLFGQSPIFKVAVDQLVPKVIGVFPSAKAGAGLSSFNITNAAAFASPMMLTDAVANMVTGGQTKGLSGSLLSTAITDITSAVASSTGASSTSMIELTRADHAIPFLYSLSTALSGGTSQFSIDQFAQGAIVAHEATQYLQQLAGGEATYKSLLDTISGISELTQDVVTNIDALTSAIGAVASGNLSGLASAAAGSINLLGGVAGVIPSIPAAGVGRQILAHIVKANGAF